MKKIIYLFVFSFLFLSCQKYHVSGRVYNPVNDEGLAGVKIVFLKTDYGSIPGGYKEVASTLTDANGYYDLKYKGKAERVKINPSPELNLYLLGNFSEGQYKTEMLLNRGKNQVIDFHAVPYGEEEIHYNNINCIGVGDTLKQYFDGSYIPYANVQIGLYGYVTGCVDVTTNPVRFPMGERYYHWEIIRNGVIEAVVYDTIFIQPNQVNTLEIIY